MNAPIRKPAPYVFFGQTTSLCETCLDLVPSKIIIEEGSVYYLKRCRQHGVQKTLIATDAAYYRQCQDYLKPADRPLAVQNRTHYGCPYDCGLCPDHEQHTCLALIDINDECNLSCPVCFADSSPKTQRQRTVNEVEQMLDTLVDAEGEPDLLQLSGGEPTLHSEFFAILDAVKARPIRHLMINTNGIRIARDPDFVATLAEYKPGIEVYLQFDSLNSEVLRSLRGAELYDIHQRALQNLELHGLSTTLVCTVKKGLNDHEAGAIIQHALQWQCVRGVTFQPIQNAGRNLNFDPRKDRAVLTDIRRAIIDSDTAFSAADIIPLPCNPESIAIGYALRNGEQIVPITSMIPQEAIVSEVPNAITFEKYPELQRRVFDFFSLSTTPNSTAERLQALLCCLPEVTMPTEINYENTFRVAIVEFLDAHNFCLSRVKRSCIHFVTPQRQIIPFDTYNLFYRDGKIDKIRRQADQRQSDLTGG